MVGIQIRADIKSVLIKVQTVCLQRLLTDDKTPLTGKELIMSIDYKNFYAKFNHCSNVMTMLCLFERNSASNRTLGITFELISNEIHETS